MPGKPARILYLPEKIAILLDDRGRRERMGEYNRRRFLEHMAWEYSVGELLRAYEVLCGPHRAR